MPKKLNSTVVIKTLNLFVELCWIFLLNGFYCRELTIPRSKPTMIIMEKFQNLTLHILSLISRSTPPPTGLYTGICFSFFWHFRGGGGLNPSAPPGKFLNKTNAWKRCFWYFQTCLISSTRKKQLFFMYILDKNLMILKQRYFTMSFL